MQCIKPKEPRPKPEHKSAKPLIDSPIPQAFALTHSRPHARIHTHSHSFMCVCSAARGPEGMAEFQTAEPRQALARFIQLGPLDWAVANRWHQPSHPGSNFIAISSFKDTPTLHLLRPVLLSWTPSSTNEGQRLWLWRQVFISAHARRSRFSCDYRFLRHDMISPVDSKQQRK